MKIFISMLCLALLLSSCEKTLDLDYKENSSTLVIQGNITDEAGPYYVKISKSIPLKDTGSYPAIDDAVVRISDDAGNAETLTSVGNGTYRTNTLVGVPGRTYVLNVEAESRSYTAQSTMPLRVPFDSLKVEEEVFMSEIEYNLVPIYLDPVAKGNNYRFVLSVNGKLINQHLVQNDEVRNGLVNNLKVEINDDDLEFKKGDVLQMSMFCIDRKVSLYYTALAMMGNSGPGGGTTPNNPPGNLSNGALGIFSAHTIETKTTTIR